MKIINQLLARQTVNNLSIGTAFGSMQYRIPMVLLPGTGCNEHLWDQVLPYIPKSIKPVHVNLLTCSSMQEMMDKIHGLPYEKFFLVGFSMGGSVAYEYSLRFPERVYGRILMNCSLNKYNDHQKEKIQLFIKQIENKQVSLASAKYLSQFVDIQSPQSDSVIEKLMQMLNCVGDEAVCRQMAVTLDRNTYQVNNSKNNKAIPTFVVGATGDQLVPRSHIESLKKLFSAEMAWINCGHMTPLEEPSQVGFALNGWLTRQTAALAKQPTTETTANVTPAGDQKGYLLQKLDPCTQKFIDIVTQQNANQKISILEVGSGLGIPSRILLTAGFNVIANDTNAQLLTNLWHAVDLSQQQRLSILWGNITDYQKIDIKVNGVIANRVLHFFSGAQLEKFFQQLNSVLSPGGRVVVTVASPAMNLFVKSNTLYDSRKKSGMKYPGWMNVHSFLTEQHRRDLPKKMHLFKAHDLKTLFENHGYITEYIGSHTSAEEPIEFQSSCPVEGARVGIIARKP